MEKHKIAGQEACQLFIEQEIEAGLAKGKTKYSIGKEIAEWIEKLFGAEVKPHTIEQRAHRQEEKILTNVSSFDFNDLTEPQKQIFKLYEESKKEKRNQEIKEKKDAYKQRVVEIKEKLETNPIITELPNLLLVDPPWRYDFAETDNRKIENQYSTLSVVEMKDHLPKIQKDCIMFMWATAPKLREAFELIDLWNFTYKTHAIWDKKIIGSGYWFRGQHELLLVATTGNVSPPIESLRRSSIFEEQRTKHSKKPSCVYEWIENSFGDKIKMELYCRKIRVGWLAWGDEVE